MTSWPHVQTAQQSGSTPTTARKPKSSKDIIGLADAPSDDLRPSSEDTRRIAVIIDEAHRGVPDDGAFYQERGQGFKVVVLRRRSPPQI